jgi:hypothetical protein
VPHPALSSQEKRLASFCRVFAVVYLAGAVVFAGFPRLTWRLATLGNGVAAWDVEARFWNVLAVSMMTAVAAACLVTAGSPRERRHAILPVVVAKLTSGLLAAIHLAGGARSAALLAIVVSDLPLFLLTLAVYRAAAPGVHSEPAREGPPQTQVEVPPIQLKVSKS